MAIKPDAALGQVGSKSLYRFEVRRHSMDGALSNRESADLVSIFHRHFGRDALLQESTPSSLDVWHVEVTWQDLSCPWFPLFERGALFSRLCCDPSCGSRRISAFEVKPSSG